MTTLLGGLGACGDGEDTPIGNGGASTGGKGSGNGGAAGMGGSRVSGGFSGSTAKGGNGGGSGASTGGAGGTPAVAGEAGTLGEGGTAPNAGASGSGGGAELPVEYRGCETGAAITRIALYRIDRAQQTCTLVMVQQGLINCLDGLTSGGWCVTGAAIGNDIEACEAFQMPSDPIQATAGEGTFTISTQPLAIDIDVEFEFPASSGLPESISVAADNCLANCAMNDCRPVE